MWKASISLPSLSPVAVYLLKVFVSVSKVHLRRLKAWAKRSIFRCAYSTPLGSPSKFIKAPGS
jgi:hypothetical protein